MLPDDTLIQSDIHHFKPPRAGYYGTTEAFSQGGVALGNVTQDWFGYTWRAYIKPDGVYLNRTDTTEHKLVLALPNIEQIDFCFDQNMNVVIAYTVAGRPYLYAYAKQGYQQRALPDGARCPRVVLDRVRQSFSSQSDIIVGFMRDGSIYYLLQREDYLKEHLVASDPTKRKSMLWRMGWTQDGRIGFAWR